MRFLIPWVLFLFAATLPAAAHPPVARHLNDISVTVVAGFNQGSGVIVTRELDVGGKKRKVHFVWTAAHVVESLRRVRTVIRDGKPHRVVEFADATIVTDLYENGRRVGKTSLEAVVVRYSDPNYGHDLALLRVRKFATRAVSARFYLDPASPGQGSELFHCGSMLGEFGSASLTNGIISKNGRVLLGTTFTQVTTTAFPGSSGGGVYLKDGRCVGLIVAGIGGGGNFNFAVPYQRMRAWAAAANIGWAFDPKRACPTMREIESAPVEQANENRTRFNPGKLEKRYWLRKTDK